MHSTMHFCIVYDMSKNYIVIISSILLVAGLGTLFTQLGMEWFNSLIKPNEWVPAFIFPIVWTTIYLLFAYVLIKQQQTLTTKSKVFLIINGILNVLWCLIFFTLNQLLLGNIVIVINTVFGFLLFKEIYKINNLSGWLIFIYPIWLSLATTLNLAVWILN